MAHPRALEWTPERVRAFWNGVQKTPLRERSFSLHAGRAVALLVRRHLARGARVVDFGGGDGTLARILAAGGIVATVHEPAVERLAAVDVDRLPAAEADRGRFDGLVLSEVLEHVLDVEMDETFDAIRSLLAPGGIIVVTVPNDERLDDGLVYCPVSETYFHRWQHVRAFTVESLDAFMAGRGFRRIAGAGTILDDRIARLCGVFGPGPAPAVMAAVLAVVGVLAALAPGPLRRRLRNNLVWVGRRSAP
jgi:2-polyprenyl-3-methyl-5-hydroxy-6-metoxy-1,4-benzoquinol methylase